MKNDPLNFELPGPGWLPLLEAMEEFEREQLELELGRSKKAPAELGELSDQTPAEDRNR
jgi:hypothetical protein